MRLVADALTNKRSSLRSGASRSLAPRWEPLAPSSPLWTMHNVFLTPHTAGETRRYEDNVLDILTENLDRLLRDERTLRNQII